MRMLLGVFLALCAAAPVAAQAPGNAVASAWVDVQTVPPPMRATTRYLDLGDEPPERRETLYRVLCGHVQHLSTQADITRPEIVPGTAGALLRIDYRAYGWKRDVWESLADSDPYFHAIVVTEKKTVTEWPGGYYSDGVYYAPKSFKTYRTEKTSVGSLAPWLGDAKIVDALCRETKSRVPVVRGKWFFWQTAAQADRKPGYYDFLGVRNRKTYEALGGFDRKTAAIRPELRDAVALSDVTLQPRAIARFDVPGGSYWYSVDFKKATDGQNPLVIFGPDIEKKADAFEAFITLPNLFWATGLFNREGDRQDAAPDFIASDGMSKSNDRRVHVNVSCIRCHPNGGLRDVDAFVRNLIQPPLALQPPDYEERRKLAQQYTRSLEKFITKDRLNYEDAVMEATGWNSRRYAAEYASLWEATEDAKIDLAWAARDLGASQEHFRRAILHQVALGKAHPVLANLTLKDRQNVGEPLENNRRSKRIGIRQWFEVYGLAQQYLVSVKEK